MAVTTPRESWTDQRLNDLNQKVDDGFARMDKDIRELRSDINARFDRLTIGLLISAVGIIATLLGTSVF
jgi:hypothetical protein